MRRLIEKRFSRIQLMMSVVIAALVGSSQISFLNFCAIVIGSVILEIIIDALSSET